MKHSRRARHAFGSLLAIIAFSSAIVLADVPDPSGGDDELSLDDLRTFSDVFNLVRKHYVDEIPERRLLDSALQGLVASLDPHSVYMGPDAFRDHSNSTQGQHGGVGAQTRIRDGKLLVSRVIRDSPADLAGVREGDLVLAIDGEKVRGRKLALSQRALQGEPGSEVDLRLKSGDMRPRRLTLTREVIRVPSVESTLLEGDIALLRIQRFTHQTAEEFETELLSLTPRDHETLQGGIIDLRNNYGGIIRGATLIADGFLDEGLVVYTRGRYPESRLEYHAEPGQWLPDLPLAVMINGSSASASEILAGALQDHDRAILVGTDSYGKGTVQSVLQMRNGSALKLTTARYFTPAGRSIDKTGISPDIDSDDDNGRREDFASMDSIESDRTLQLALGALKPTGKP